MGDPHLLPGAEAGRRRCAGRANRLQLSESLVQEEAGRGLNIQALRNSAIGYGQVAHSRRVRGGEWRNGPSVLDVDGGLHHSAVARCS